MTVHVTPVTLPTLQWGEPDAPRTVLLLHGLTSAAGTWWRVADSLAATGVRVVAADLRGHGRAPRTLSYPIAGFAADVLQLHPAPGAPWDAVVGHSLGGATAAAALGTLGDAASTWARSAVLVDPALRRLEPASEALLAGMSAEAEDPDAARIASENPDWHAEDVHQKVVAARLISKDTVRRVLSDPWDESPAIAGTGIPVTLLGADATAPDLALTPALGAELAANPRVTYEEVVGAHHSIHRTHPDVVVAAVVAALAALPARSPSPSPSA
ncbi:alpha/beta hydrolase [Frondihabitans cladoniiphilus]|uniref:Alpha/beta fold hydrolase n=1 Tax=Frondihabitans cladoniiphilus TaxID=715785 RepID=A0ABP8VJH2_9MICO